MLCSPYYSVTLPACPDSIAITGGLTPDTQYRWQITDKFQHIYTGATLTDTEGVMHIVVAGNTALPKGLFNEYAGVFTLQVFPMNSELPVDLTIDATTYPAIQLRFKKYIGDGSLVPDAPKIPIIVDGSKFQDTAIIPAGTTINRVLIQAPEGTTIAAGLSAGLDDVFPATATGPQELALLDLDQLFATTTTLYFTGMTLPTTIILFTS